MHKKILYCIALPRSGHHAVLYWLANQRKVNTEILITENCSDDNSLFLQAPSCQEEENTVVGNKDIARYLDNPNGLVIINEDSNRRTLYQINRTIGTLNKVYNDSVQPLIVLRDYYNNLASCLAKKVTRGYVHKIEDKWTQYAQEGIGESEIIQNTKLVLYNKWFTSVLYRYLKCKELGFTFTDKGTNRIPQAGSSFDARKYDGEAKKMNVLARYGECLEDPKFIEHTRNERIKALNLQIFGWTI